MNHAAIKLRIKIFLIFSPMTMTFRVEPGVEFNTFFFFFWWKSNNRCCHLRKLDPSDGALNLVWSHLLYFSCWSYDDDENDVQSFELGYANKLFN